MTCDSIKRAIPLYLYGELPPETEESVEAHTNGCAECARELEVQREFARSLNEHELEPSLDLLVECRRSLAVELRNQEAEQEPKGLATLWNRIFGFPMNNFRIPAGAMALFALGFLAARTPQLTAVLPGGVPGGMTQAGLISSVRSIEPDRSGVIRISVDDTQRRVISGGLDDEKIRELLLMAMQEQGNAGVRVESASVLKDLAGSEDVRKALLKALQHDPNPGVRLKALEGLHQFAYDPGVRQILTTVLMSDSNEGVRIQAIDLLTSRHDDSIVSILQSLVHKDDNDYVRLRCVRALQEMNASVGSF
jgi:Putative zinc-finger/HEAT repeats